MAEDLSHYRNSENKAEAPQDNDAETHTRAVAEYLSDMIGQLEGMARQQGLDLLVYLLSMARVEAETAARDRGSRRRTSA